MTNLEWVGTLTEEELAELLEDTCEMCIRDCDNCSCISGHIAWLQKEHIEKKHIDECPHCGSSIIDTHKDIYGIAYVECRQCGALISDKEGNLDRAISKWNRSEVND